MNNSDVISLIRKSKYPPLTKRESEQIWKHINERLFADALLDFKNEMVDIQKKIINSIKAHEQGIKGTDKDSLTRKWHQGYRNADQWFIELLDKSFARLGRKIMGIDPVGLPKFGKDVCSKEIEEKP